ncbi:MAG: YeeE/YedE family protein [Armatimonadota bacterium]|nr:YeeE/YedE family protein [Armatimonadota bacterium]
MVGSTMWRHPLARLLGVGAAALLVSAVVARLTARTDARAATFWLFGLAFGFVLQRSRFCFASAFRDLFLFGHGRIMRGILGGLAVATAGFAVLMQRMVPNPSLGVIAPEAHVAPLGAHLILGGLLFGVGMVIAGGCVSGSLYRIGEGYVASGVALLGIVAGLALGAHTWNFWWRSSIRGGLVLWLPQVGGYGMALVVTFLLLLGAYLLVVWWEVRQGFRAPEPVPGPPGHTFGERIRGALRAVLVHGWPASAGGVALGTLNVFLYTAHMPWGVTGEISRWAVGLLTLVGWGPGLLQGAGELSGCALVGRGGPLLTHTLTLTLGMVAGAFVGAQVAGEFRLRRPRERRRYLQALAGGVLMGYGATLAMGCTLGAFFSAIPSLGANGWVFAAALAAGAWLGVQVLRRIP